MRCFLIFFLLFVSSPGLVLASEPASLPVIARGIVAAVEPGFILRLADGRSLRLALLVTEDAEHADSTRQPLSNLLNGKAVTLYWPGPQPDRHGRLTGHVVRDDDSLWIQRSLIETGVARLLPFASETALLTPLLAAEAAARRDQRGRWGQPDHALRTPSTAGQAIGRFAVVEGTVTAAADVRGTVYLNFGPDWRTDYTVVLPDAVVKTLRDRGHDPAALTGRIVRARGWLERYNGPSLKLSAPEQLGIVSAD